MENTMGNDKAM